MYYHLLVVHVECYMQDKNCGLNSFFIDLYIITKYNIHERNNTRK